MRIAFYAPMKPPDHPVPSGDREMARLLMAALRHAGHTCEIVSRLRTYVQAPDQAALERFHADARQEVEALLASWRDDPAARPHVWLTYHPYYKAPDLVGPAVAAALDLPYATAEASHAGKRDRDGWRAWQAPVTQALRQGAVHFCLTPVDHEGLAHLLGGEERLVRLPPFVDGSSFAAVERRTGGDRLELVAVAMMRPGKKVRSYRHLADALRALGDIDWRLTIVGDGEARAEVEAAFEAFGADRVCWRGEVTRADLPAVFAAADLFVWPGFEEDYGMVYLEAQAAGLPVVAIASNGVRQVVRDGETGLLLANESPETFALALRALTIDAGRRASMGKAAQRFAQDERSVGRAAAILDRALAAVVQGRSSPAQRGRGTMPSMVEGAAAASSVRAAAPSTASGGPPPPLRGGGSAPPRRPCVQDWRPLVDELDRWAAAGRVASLWLRDDDAVEPTPALDRLLDLTNRHGVPVLLAVIPAATTSALADRLRDRDAVAPCQHGCAHRNHAGPDEKKQELGAQRPLAVIIDELAAARDRLAALFGTRVAPILVPPWNRIAPEVTAALPGLGFRALSTFGRPRRPAALRQINCDIDIIDWKGSRGGRDRATLVAALTEALAVARREDFRPVGVLTHHLVHDAIAWSFLDALLRCTAAHPAAEWIGWEALLGHAPSPLAGEGVMRSMTDEGY